MREHARHLLLDGVACALVGAQLPVSRKGVEAITALDDAGSAQLIGWDGLSTSAPSAAMLNSSFIQGFELDDYHPLAPLHSNSLVIPAMLAATPHVGTVSGSRFLFGAILGYETGPRVGQALHGLEMISRGWHSGVVFGTHSAAAAAGALYGLDAAGFEDALGMAGTQSCGLMSAQFESMVKRMQHGFASRAGLTAAALAASGYVGIKRVFERDYGGWLPVFGEGHHPNASEISAGLGTVWETARIAVKAYAAMGLLHAGIDAALKLRSENVPVDQIKHIEVDLAEGPYQHGGWQAVRPLAADRRADEHRLRRRGRAPGRQRADRPVRRRPDQPRRRVATDRPHPNPPRRVLRQAPGRRAAQNPSTSYARGRRRPGSDRHSPPRNRRPSAERLRHRREVPQPDPLPWSSPERQAAIEQAVLGIDKLDDISELMALMTPMVKPALD